ncbi:MAG: type IX secretion system membrane protein PorP/SprF [Cyclobacteriaceae bacterium]|nr:type IX secretion system membrane protein PorP/SprF [Cyclobacteriaceae bacterium]MDH4294727.1 type IX secretion system membrane protein PorP/SprF [Cyclobacteriaceae bacterium]MDH5247555.1 type IX secretion system membrane protein PorP/SprF [Cyclobacteriaceae bacterium]
MLKRIFYTLLMLLLGAGAFAQQDALFTQYMFNNLYVTPAFAGVDGVTRLTAVHRSQWLGYQSSFGDGGAPTSQLVTFNTPIYKLKSGFGAYIMNDKLGPQNNLEAQAMYAYHLGIKESKLSFGIKLGLYSQTVNGKYYRYIQEGDPLIVEGKESQVRPDLGLGIFYRAEKYYAGVGFNHLLRSKFDFGADSVRGALENHINFTGGYFYEVSFDLKVQFSAAVRTDLNKTQVDFAGIAHIKDTMWGGLAFRQSEAASLLLGYSIFKDKSLKIGTAVDFIVKDQAAKENFSLEFMLSYDLPVNPGSGKKVVRTPRYRH